MAIKNNPIVIDLFCGAGGLSLGFKLAGFKILYATDYWEDCLATYYRNHKGVVIENKDIRAVSGIDVLKKLNRKKGDVDAVIGGPPCQGFSLAGRSGRKHEIDPRNNLVMEFARLVTEIQPKYFLMENVAALTGKPYKGLVANFISYLRDAGYETEFNILNAVDYGVPQFRRRVFFIGNRLGLSNPFPEHTEKTTSVKQAIADLANPATLNSKIANHVAMKHTKQMLRKMSYVTDGGTRAQIPKEFKPKSGDARKYIRYTSNLPSICVTGDMRKVFHYSQNRALTVRELARLQSFPDNYVFEGTSVSQQLQVGNAVPPLLGKAVAEEIKRNITNKKDFVYARIKL